MDGTTIESLLRWGVTQLAEHNDPGAPLDAQVLLSHVLNQSRTQLLAFGEREVAEADQRTYRQLIKQRTEGQPVAYLLGEREFWSLNLYTDPSTLIPRPDTERLVEVTLETLGSKPETARPLHLVDLGCGTGAVALALASERPNWSIQAIDLSEQAVTLAKRNAERHGLERVEIFQNHWLDGFRTNSLDAVVSNPPYVADEDPHLSQGDVRFEPRSALTSGPDGLDDIRLIAQQAQKALCTGGWLLLEHGYDQAERVAELLTELGYQHIENFTDYGGQPRVTRAQKP